VGIPNTYKLLSEKDCKFKYFKIFEKEKIFILSQKSDENWEIFILGHYEPEVFRSLIHCSPAIFYVYWTVHHLDS